MTQETPIWGPNLGMSILMGNVISGMGWDDKDGWIGREKLEVSKESHGSLNQL